MADPTLATIAAALVTACNADLGTYDFSATGAVLRGRYQRPPGDRPAFIGIASPAFSDDQGPHLREYTDELIFDVDVWVAYDGKDTDSRTQAGEAVMVEVAKAIRGARNTSGNALSNCREFRIRGAVLDEDVEISPRGMARAMLEVRLVKSSERDVGP